MQFAAIIELDEEIQAENAKANGLKELSPSDYIKHEFEWLRDSGIILWDLQPVFTGSNKPR